MQDVYADVILLVNFVMNTFVLWAVSKLNRQSWQGKQDWRKNKVRYFLRLSLGGFVMALLYVLLVITVPFGRLVSVGASIVLLSIGVWIGIRPKGWRAFLGNLLLGYVCSFTLGGLGMMLFYTIGMPGYHAPAPTYISWTLLVSCIFGAYLLIKLGLRVIEKITIKKQTLCPVTISVGGCDVSLQALVDTGHTLHDPLSNSPVIIAEFETIKTFLPDSLRLIFYENQENDLSGLLEGAIGSTFHERIRMIPFVSLGLPNGMLIGFRPDSVCLSVSQVDFIRDDVVIGIYNRKLCASGRYQGLIGAELVA